MRYLVLLKGTQPATPPPPALMEAIMNLGAEATAAGALVDNAGLAPSAAGALVQLTGGHLSVVDGPFAEAKEFISYALYEVRSKEEAVRVGVPLHARCTWSLSARLGGRVRRCSRSSGQHRTGRLPARHDRLATRPCHTFRSTRGSTAATDGERRAPALGHAAGCRGGVADRIRRGSSPGWPGSPATSGSAEELAQDALVAALEQWPRTGIPPTRPAG